MFVKIYLKSNNEKIRTKSIVISEKRWYNSLKEEKAIAAGNYADCRENIAWRYGKLLSYTDEGIQRLLDANSDKE